MAGNHRRRRSFPVKGAFIRTLRRSRGWTQEQAEEESRVRKCHLSVRTLRTAEQGGPLDAKYVGFLVQLYSSPEQPLAFEDLIPKRFLRRRVRPVLAETLVRRWFEELWNRRNFEVIDELLAPDVVYHGEGHVLRGADAFRRRAEAIHAAFSDLVVRLDDVTVKGDLVICRWSGAITHTGTWLGNPPTGRRIHNTGSTWLRVKGSRFVEGWDYWEQTFTEATARQ